MDPRILAGRGPRSFTIHGELRHRIGALLPQLGHEGTYVQLYIYDPDSALNVRNRRNPHLRRDVLQTIQDTLLHVATDRRRYNLPTSDEIAVILPGDGTEVNGMRDIVLHLRGKLFQEFLVDAWATTEQNRLNYNRFNQGRLRAEFYKDLTDIGADGLGLDQVGQRIILPSSFVGSSPRHMFEIFQDSMAITRYNHHLDIFLTMTANPNWPEITSALLPYQNPTDRPNLVARVFELKRKFLMKEIEKKRVDIVVSAEFPSPEDDPILFETVKSVMVHGSCDARNLNAPCLDNNGRCTKRYPKAFAEGTTMDQDGYPIYRRRNDGRVYIVKGQDVDNRDVVPYNAYLSKMFNCHINVEACAGMRCVKYIHKYIYKGHDRTTMVLGGVDEIQQYIDSRYIGAPKAARRILGHNLHEEFPTVVRLALHLPGMHHVIFDETESMNSIISRAKGKMSTLTGYFACCTLNEAAQAFTYQEFPQHFVWHKTQQIWTPRQRGYAIGRMYFVAPTSGARTAHSTFCIPLDVQENSICGFGKQSLQAELFRETKLIIWDEVPMQHRYCVEMVDRTLKDICDNINPFGDWEQSERNRKASFNNTHLSKSQPIVIKGLSLTGCARNWEPTTYLAADKMSEDDEVDRNITNRYPNEYLNSLNPPSLPPFKVELKVGCPIMLLRNIALNDGLCNGTRLMVVRCASRIIEAQILTGDKRGNLVFIPRISLTPSSSEFPFRMTRHQFPVRLAYAMTINKSQGQSVKYVGIDLRTPVFSHGQLYVALSRCTTFHHISVLLENEMDSMTNIVYP
ncbi:hypothetical protein Acr_17g0008340 [Actinidia rufa]|uniref:ATP-dependent DNA helicase n=1 Tax=Actinidia rufa TaxID=165716 RepID=A0A7J0G3B6_9ERIC|nr:hypothetical protein Acr_17g0008340 [Actinidia rufa]